MKKKKVYKINKKNHIDVAVIKSQIIIIWYHLFTYFLKIANTNASNNNNTFILS